MAASPQALGGALSYNPFLPADANAKLFALQRQAALAAALQQEGLTPLSTNDRQIGGVGYAISPMEGLNKLAQALVGTEESQQAAKDYGSIFAPQQSGNTDQTAAIQGGQSAPQSAQGAFGLPPDISQLAAGMYGMEGGPRAVAQLIDTFNKPNLAGPTAYNTTLGTSAAGNAPAGTLPAGMGGPSPQGVVIGSSRGVNASTATDALSPQTNASALAEARGGLPVPPVDKQLNIPAVPASSLQQDQQQVSSMPSPLPGETNNQYNARLKAAEAGATAKATEQGKNEGEADLNSAQISSRIDNALKNVDEMINQVPNTSTGIPLVSQNFQQDVLRRVKPGMAAANTRFEQLNNQLYVQELGPLIKQLGSRGNQFVENAVKQGSAVDIGGNDQEKLQALQGIREYLSNIQQNAKNQQGILSGQQAPTQSPYQGARQAPDGKFYVPDPNRPGKYLMVQ